MDPILRKAEQQLKDARDQVSKLESFISTYRDLQSKEHAGRGLRMSSVVTAGQGVVTTTGLPVVGETGETGKMRITERVAGRIIRDNGGPVPSSDMLAQLRERNVDVGGKDPASTLAARLSRASTIEFKRGHGWTLKSDAAQMNEAADPTLTEGKSAASETPNDAERRGEVAHHNIS